MTVDKNTPILVTGARGFIGKWVVARLLERGFTRIRCLVRPASSKPAKSLFPGARENDERFELVEGNLLSREDCRTIAKDVGIVYHLAAGRGDKSYPSAFQNSVVTTRNLLDACLEHGRLTRFVNVSSFTVYTNRDKPQGRLLDESCPTEGLPLLRANAYCFAKTKQEEMLFEYAEKRGLPYANLRPGTVYGPGNEQLYGRVGIGTFGIFLHLGGPNKIPLSYVENCAEAIVLAGLTDMPTNETYNVVDDDLPSSRRFLKLYKRHVKSFPSIYLPHAVSYSLCWLWEKAAAWSKGQLPGNYNRREWHANWKRTRYSNAKLKERLGWTQTVPTAVGLERFFESCREKERHA